MVATSRFTRRWAGPVVAALVAVAFFIAGVPSLYPRYSPPQAPNPTLADVTAYQQQSHALGVTSAGEYVPRWAIDPPRKPGFPGMDEGAPLAAKVDAQKKFMWANICVSSAVFKGRNLKYVFRCQVHSDTYGLVSPDFIAHYAKSRLGKDVKDVRVAIIHEDGPYGSGIASGSSREKSTKC